jgi:SAM-dependent methyltransferase
MIKLLLLILIIILLIIIFYNIEKNKKETFENIKKIDILDFTTKLYNIVFDDKKIYENDIKIINKFLNKNSKILDAGCGIGKHYKLLSKKYNILGIDNNVNFLKYAKIINPNGIFINGDLKDEKILENKKFTHILLLWETLYKNKYDDMDKIISNLYFWLENNGLLFVHIFNRNKLDPAPREFSQYYKDSSGKKHSLTYFYTFTHDAHWKIKNDNEVKYIENIILENKKKIYKENQLNIPIDNRKIINKIIKFGFKLKDIKKLDYIDDYDLYIFEKIKYKNNMIKL